MFMYPLKISDSENCLVCIDPASAWPIIVLRHGSWTVMGDNRKLHPQFPQRFNTILPALRALFLALAIEPPVYNRPQIWKLPGLHPFTNAIEEGTFSVEFIQYESLQTGRKTLIKIGCTKFVTWVSFVVRIRLYGDCELFQTVQAVESRLVFCIHHVEIKILHIRRVAPLYCCNVLGSKALSLECPARLRPSASHGDVGKARREGEDLSKCRWFNLTANQRQIFESCLLRRK